jgi:hypothetical protein
MGEEWGTFIYGSGEEYGADADELGIDVLSSNVIRVRFSSTIVVDSEYLDETNYVVEDENGTALTVRRILDVSSSTATDAVVVMNHPVEGMTYTVVVSNIRNTSGFFLSESGKFIARRSKLTNMLASLPRHYNKSPESVIYSILSAFALEDDLIGGSRDDTFTA